MTISKLFPVNVVSREGVPGHDAASIYPEEYVFVRNAVAKRKQEFSAGRLLAKEALQDLGIDNFPIVVAEDKSPLWPKDIVGSVAHTQGYCGVALTRQRDYKSLGFDAEQIKNVSPEIWEQVCTPKELAGIQQLPKAQQQEHAALIFSAKECFYKLQYPLTKAWVDFQDVELLLDLSNQRFQVRPLTERLSDHWELRRAVGRFLFTDGMVLTGMWV